MDSASTANADSISTESKSILKMSHRSLHWPVLTRWKINFCLVLFDFKSRFYFYHIFPALKCRRRDTNACLCIIRGLQSQLKSTAIDRTPDHAFRSLRNHFRFVLSHFYRFLNDPIKQSVDCIIVNINFHFESNCLYLIGSLRGAFWARREIEEERRDETIPKNVSKYLFDSRD